MDPRKLPDRYYENLEFAVNDSESDIKASDQTGWGDSFGVGPAATNKGGYATRVSIRTDRTITIKLNKSTNHSVTITAADSPYELDDLMIEEIFFSNASGGTANIKVFLTR